MKKHLLIIFAFVACAGLYANGIDILTQNPFSAKQKNEFSAKDTTTKWTDKISFDGIVSVNFGSFGFALINPQIIYKVNSETWIAAGPFYQYQRINTGTSTSTYSIYGATAFGRRYLTENLFLQAEYNLFNFPVSNAARQTRSYGLAGGGYAPNRNLSITVLYVFTATGGALSPYGNSPWVIRGGIYF